MGDVPLPLPVMTPAICSILQGGQGGSPCQATILPWTYLELYQRSTQRLASAVRIVSKWKGLINVPKGLWGEMHKRK